MGLLEVLNNMDGRITVVDALFGIPNKLTGGLFGNAWVAGIYGIFFLAFLLRGNSVSMSMLGSSWTTWLASIMLFILGPGSSELVLVTTTVVSVATVGLLIGGGRSV